MGFGFDIALQVAQDYNNPYLSTGDKYGRALTSAGAGAISGYVVSMVYGTGIPGFIAGVGIGATVESLAVDRINQFFGLINEINLRPWNH